MALDAMKGADALARKILHKILSDGLGEGDLFMTESQVAEQYSVSRNAVREAVSRLRGLGILESRQGKGLLVAKPDPVSLLSDTIPFLGQSPQGLVELSQLRYILETGAIDLAVQSATEEQIARIEELAARHERILTAESAKPDEADRTSERDLEQAFHGLLLEMTGNPLIAGLHRVLTDFFRLSEEQMGGWSRMQPHAVWQHRAIAEALRQRDVEQARVLLRQHLQPVHEWAEATKREFASAATDEEEKHG